MDIIVQYVYSIFISRPASLWVVRTILLDNQYTCSQHFTTVFADYLMLNMYQQIHVGLTVFP